MTRARAALLGACGLLGLTGRGVPAPPARDYLVYVASESADKVARVRFGPKGIAIEHQRYVGSVPNEIAGPHGVSVSPDGKHYFVTTAHGMPFGYLQKYSTATDSVEGNVALGSFPATVQVSPDGFYAWVANFNLHGDRVPSSISVVGTDDMLEVARIETCAMPHGSRLTRDGRRHYSVCMMDEALVEIDARTMRVARHFVLTRGHERGGPGTPAAGTAAHDMSGHGMQAPPPGDATCSPTWAQPSADGRRVWIACNRSSEIVELDAAAWTVLRRLPAGPGVYNLGLTHDGTRLLATNKRDRSVSVIDLGTGRELARIQTTRRVVHGVAVSDDDRYAFVSMEGTGAEPGTMDVIDLAALARVASIDLGPQAGGIEFFRSEAVRR